MITEAYINAIKSNNRYPVFKIEWMDKDEIVVDEVITDMISGNISMQLKNGIRRTCNLTLENKDGSYIPSKDGLVWIGKKIKLYSGLIIDGVSYYVPQGVFNLHNPVVSSALAENTVRIEGSDNFDLFEQELKYDYIIPLGTNIGTAVQQIFTDVNIPTTPVIQATDEVLPYTIIKEAGDTYTSLLVEIADILSREIFFDTNGRGRFQDPIDTSSSIETWTFSSDEVNYEGGEHNHNFEKVKNYVKVLGENINGNLVVGIAQNTNIFSPTSISRIGEKVKVISDSNIYNAELATERAEYELNKLTQIEIKSNVKSVPVDILKEGDIIILDDVNSGNNRTRFLIKSINLPLSYTGKQTIGMEIIYDG